MAAVALIFAFLIYQVNSQIVGLGPPFPIPRGCESNTPCTEIRPSLSVCDTCGIKTLPNLVITPITNTKPCNQPCSNKPMAQILNLAATPCVKSQPLFSQPISTVLPTQPIVSNVVPKCQNVQVCPVCSNAPKCSNVQISPVCSNTPKCPNVQVSQIAPSVCTNTATPQVVTVVDNTLANSLANALQLLIISNLLESSGPGNSGNLPCINNYEIVTPDFTLPSISCDLFSNSCSEQVSCPDTTYSCSEAAISCPEPVVVQSCPTNFGGSFSYVDASAGFPCGLNDLFVQGVPQCGQSPSFVCSEPISPVPVVASVPPMAIEVPFPASIPAQLTCNLGFLPTNEPCVTFNVEALPCSNIIGSYGSFI